MQTRWYLIALLFILIFNDQLFCNSNIHNSDSIPSTKSAINFGISVSPRYSKIIYRNFNAINLESDNVGNVMFNYNINIYYNIKRTNISLDFGFSFLQYGNEETPIRVLKETTRFGFKVYDTIPANLKYRYLAFPIGINKCIHLRNISFLGEIGIVNNVYQYVSIISSFKEYYIIKPFAELRSHKYIGSVFVKLGILLKNENTFVSIEPILNYFPYNLSSLGYGNIDMYQIGVDVGVKFRL